MSFGLFTFAFDKTVIFGMSSFAQLRFLRKTIRRLRYVVDVERTAVFLGNTGIYGFHLLIGFRVRTYMWFHCADILIL